MEVLLYVTKSVAILSIFYMVYFAFFRKDTLFTAKRHFFLGGIIAAIILPFVEFTKIIYVEQPISRPIDFSVVTAIPTQEIATEIATQEPFNWWYVCYAFYGIGLLVFLSRLAIQLISLLRLLRKEKAYKHGRFLLIKTSETISPFSFFNYIVFNPNLHNQEELEMILCHEKVHATQWHSIDVIAGNVIRAIQWINPFSWLYKKSLEENLEYIADHKTVAQAPSKKQYQLTLVKTSSTSIAPALTTQFYQSFIKKRIIMLNKTTTQKTNIWKLSAVLPFLALFLYIFNVKEEITYLTPNTTEIEISPKFFIQPEASNETLDEMETFFRETAPVEIKISNRIRDNNGLLMSYKFQTKYKNQKRFYTRFEKKHKDNLPISSCEVQYTDGNIIIEEVGNSGIRIKISEENLNFLDPLIKNAFTPQVETTNRLISETRNEVDSTGDVMGKNPLYIVNGKHYLQSELPSNDEMKVSDGIEMYYPKEAIEKFGKKAKDGAFVCLGHTTFVTKIPNKKEITAVITKNSSPEVFKNIKAEILEQHGVELRYIDQRNDQGEINNLEFYFFENDKEIGTLGLGLYNSAPIETSTFYYSPSRVFNFWNATKEANLKKVQKEKKHYSESYLKSMASKVPVKFNFKITKNTTNEELNIIK